MRKKKCNFICFLIRKPKFSPKIHMKKKKIFSKEPQPHTDTSHKTQKKKSPQNKSDKKWWTTQTHTHTYALKHKHRQIFWEQTTFYGVSCWFTSKNLYSSVRQMHHICTQSHMIHVMMTMTWQRLIECERPVVFDTF